jgi:hypothetical protein
MDVPNWTGRRRFWYQYSASMVEVSSQSPVTVEKKGTSAARGVIGASDVSSCSRIAATCPECDA